MPAAAYSRDTARLTSRLEARGLSLRAEGWSWGGVGRGGSGGWRLAAAELLCLQPSTLAAEPGNEWRASSRNFRVALTES